MERGTTRIVAIVVVAIVVVGGIGLWIWLNPATYTWSAKDCPGVPEGTEINPKYIVKIGVIGDIGERTGDGALHGVMMAAEEINKAGGIKWGTNKTLYIGVCSADTNEAALSSKTEDGTAAAERLVNFFKVDVVIGGFRTERVLEYAPIIMQEEIPFISTGVALDLFCYDSALWGAASVSKVIGAMQYEHNSTTYANQSANLPYLNFYRNMPTNIGNLVKQVMMQVKWSLNGTGAPYGYGQGLNITYVNVIREDHVWNLGGLALIENYMCTAMGFKRGKIENVSMTATAIDLETKMGAFWDNVTKTYNHSVTIPFISAGTASAQMLKSYVNAKPASIIIGVDVPSQDLDYYTLTDGACAYEICEMTMLAGVNKTSKSTAFWDAYVAKYSQIPTYTAIGSHDAVALVNYSLNTVKTLDAPTFRIAMQTINSAATSVEVAGGWTYFQIATGVPTRYEAAQTYNTHDLSLDFGSGSWTLPVGGSLGKMCNYAVFAQWNSTGNMVLVPSSQYAAGQFPVYQAFETPAWWS